MSVAYSLTFEHVWQLIDAFNRRFPDGNTPDQLISRLAEESGELAEQVIAAESRGIKDQFLFAKEVEDVMRATLTIARYYQYQFELTFDGLYAQAAQRQMTASNQYYTIALMCDCLGKIAKHVHHAEGMGRKKEKYGEVDHDAFRTSLSAMLLFTATIAHYYHLEGAVQAAFKQSYQRMTELGFLPPATSQK